MGCCASSPAAESIEGKGDAAPNALEEKLLHENGGVSGDKNGSAGNNSGNVEKDINGTAHQRFGGTSSRGRRRLNEGDESNEFETDDPLPLTHKSSAPTACEEESYLDDDVKPTSRGSNKSVMRDANMHSLTSYPLPMQQTRLTHVSNQKTRTMKDLKGRQEGGLMTMMRGGGRRNDASKLYSPAEGLHGEGNEEEDDDNDEEGEAGERSILKRSTFKPFPSFKVGGLGNAHSTSIGSVLDRPHSGGKTLGGGGNSAVSGKPISFPTLLQGSSEGWKKSPKDSGTDDIITRPKSRETTEQKQHVLSSELGRLPAPLDIGGGGGDWGDHPKKWGEKYANSAFSILTVDSIEEDSSSLPRDGEEGGAGRVGGWGGGGGVSSSSSSARRGINRPSSQRCTTAPSYYSPESRLYQSPSPSNGANPPHRIGQVKVMDEGEEVVESMSRWGSPILTGGGGRSILGPSKGGRGFASSSTQEPTLTGSSSNAFHFFASPTSSITSFSGRHDGNIGLLHQPQSSASPTLLSDTSFGKFQRATSSGGKRDGGRGEEEEEDIRGGLATATSARLGIENEENVIFSYFDKVKKKHQQQQQPNDETPQSSLSPLPIATTRLEKAGKSSDAHNKTSFSSKMLPWQHRKGHPTFPLVGREDSQEEMTAGVDNHLQRVTPHRQPHHHQQQQHHAHFRPLQEKNLRRTEEKGGREGPEERKGGLGGDAEFTSRPTSGGAYHISRTDQTHGILLENLEDGSSSIQGGASNVGTDLLQVSSSTFSSNPHFADDVTGLSVELSQQTQNSAPGGSLIGVVGAGGDFGGGERGVSLLPQMGGGDDDGGGDGNLCGDMDSLTDIFSLAGSYDVSGGGGTSETARAQEILRGKEVDTRRNISRLAHQDRVRISSAFITELLMLECSELLQHYFLSRAEKLLRITEMEERCLRKEIVRDCARLLREWYDEWELTKAFYKPLVGSSLLSGQLSASSAPHKTAPGVGESERNCHGNAFPNKIDEEADEGGKRIGEGIGRESSISVPSPSRKKELKEGKGKKKKKRSASAHPSNAMLQNDPQLDFITTSPAAFSSVPNRSVLANAEE